MVYLHLDIPRSQIEVTVRALNMRRYDVRILIICHSSEDQQLVRVAFKQMRRPETQAKTGWLETAQRSILNESFADSESTALARGD